MTDPEPATVRRRSLRKQIREAAWAGDIVQVGELVEQLMTLRDQTERRSE